MKTTTLYHINKNLPKPVERTGVSLLDRIPKKAWSRYWLKQPVSKAVFFTTNPYAVWTFHGRRGNVYIYNFPVAAIKEAGGMHKYDLAPEVLISDDIWNKYKDNIKLIGSINQDKFESMVLKSKYTGNRLASVEPSTNPQLQPSIEQKRIKDFQRLTKLALSPRLQEIVNFMTKKEKKELLNTIVFYIQTTNKENSYLRLDNVKIQHLKAILNNNE